MGYKLSKHTDNVFAVIEKKVTTGDECAIKSFEFEDDAKKLSRHLNLGGGFDGWTPDFFNLKYQNV